MNKLDELFHAYQERQDKKAALEAELETLERERGEYIGKASAAANNGQTEEYKANSRAAADKEDEIFVKKRQLSLLSISASKEEALAAWNSYAAEVYNPAFDAKLKAYEDARAALCEQYLDLIAEQEAALEKRRRCAACAGIAPEPSPFDGFINTELRYFGMHTIPFTAGENGRLRAGMKVPADAAYFAGMDLIHTTFEEHAELDRIVRVVAKLEA